MINKVDSLIAEHIADAAAIEYLADFLYSRKNELWLEISIEERRRRVRNAQFAVITWFNNLEWASFDYKERSRFSSSKTYCDYSNLYERVWPVHKLLFK